ncbi:4-alpha-glucanotransferase [Colwelliaceae bacterium MEBiC 14330]
MELIDQLADAVGLHSSYFGTFGNKVFAKKHAKQSLLHAMGFKLDDQSLIDAIEKINNKAWLNMLPEVHIVNIEDANQTIQISLPKYQSNVIDKDLSQVYWEIFTDSENTQEHLSKNMGSGSIDLTQLTTAEFAEIHGISYQHYHLSLPKLAQGYYQFTIRYGELNARCPLIYAPKTCYSPKEVSTAKMWGYTAQLYSLKSKNNWGIGDFSDLKSLVKKSAKQQSATIGLNPLHPLYYQNPAHRSPYSPSSRRYLNTLYIDVTKIPNFESCEIVQQRVADPAFKKALADTNSSKLIDYVAVAKLKHEITELLYEDFIMHQDNETDNNTYQGMQHEFTCFKSSQKDLIQFATFDALFQHFNSLDSNSYGWTDWPKEFQTPNSEAVINFQKKHPKRIDYFCFLQWLADKQLSEVAQATYDNNMAIGLYLDLAVGCDGSGFDVWSDQQTYVAGASIGAPPDDMNALGQNWGLTPINPLALRKQGYQPLVKALRNNMQYAGALRIDHILGLMRQYWVAPGMDATEGVYISFPWHDILRIIALESRLNQCIVIGEDLGNVPEGFSETIQNAGLLSFKVLFFERWQSGLFKRPENFPSQSIVTVATHDTATLSGWWQGRDLEWRQQLNLYPNDDIGVAERNGRAQERQNLLAAFVDLDVIDLNKAPSSAPAIMNNELSIATQKYLAASPSHLQLIPIEDALELTEQVNIPGTIDQHPNWLQKLPVLLEEFEQVESVKNITEVMNIARPK